jgi:glycosyltransferase involved in cell wall biosynthesis
MLKILQIYYEPISSGQSTHVLSLTESLVRRGHQVSVILPERLQQNFDNFSYVGATVIPLQINKILWKPEAIIEFLRLIHQENYQIVHVHSQEAGLVARPLARISGAKSIVYTPQTINIRRTRWNKVYSFIERILAMITDKVISVNEVDRLRLIHWDIPSRKVISIPNGIDLHPYIEQPDLSVLRKILKIETQGPVVMQIGRLSPQKNPIAFLEGANLILRDIPNATFVMVGQGPLKEVLEKRINALELDGRIHIIDHQPNAYQLPAAADVVTLTSLWEGTPYSLLEAMAWSKPVAATNVNGCSEVVLDGKTGFLSPPGDFKLWANNVSQLLGDPDCAKDMGKLGRRHLEELYTLQKMVTKVEELYYELLK